MPQLASTAYRSQSWIHSKSHLSTLPTYQALETAQGKAQKEAKRLTIEQAQKAEAARLASETRAREKAAILAKQQVVQAAQAAKELAEMEAMCVGDQIVIGTV